MTTNKKPLAQSIAVIALSAMALDTAYAAIEEVTVTAQRRAQNIQDVPLAITALSEEELQERQIDEPIDLINYVPNLFGGNNTGLGTANAYYLRGLGNTESIATFDPPVGTYVDNVYIARQNGNNVSFFDIDRIEVMRGPQGTLFGRNTTGGAVSIHMKKPAEELGGWIEGSIGDFDRTMVRGSVDVPMSDSMLTKFSGFWLDEDGFVQNRTTGDELNGDEAWGIRTDLRFIPNESIIWDISAEMIESSSLNITNSFSDLSSFARPYDNGISDNSEDRYSQTGIRASDDSEGSLEQLSNGDGLGNRVDSWAISSNLAWEGDFGTLTFITGIRSLEQKFIIDFFDGPGFAGTYTIANSGEHDQFTQEIKYNNTFMNDRVDFVGGVYYHSEDNTTDWSTLFDIGLPLLLADREMDNDNTSFAVYGQADFQITEALTFTAGIRWTDEEKEVDLQDFKPGLAANNPYPNILIFPSAPGSELTTANLEAQGIATKLDESVVTPRFAVQWQITDNLMAFASHTEGFKSGGWNARGTSAQELIPFDIEEVETQELGFRSDWLDGTLRLNATFFWMEATDFQVPSAFVRDNGTIAFITQNFADLENEGLEIDASWAPNEMFSMYATAGFQDAEQIPGEAIREQQANCQAGLGGGGQGIVTPSCEIADQTRSPDSTYTIGANLTAQLPSFNGYLSGNINVRRTDDINVGTSGLPNGLVDATTEMNAGITLGVGENLRFALECQNCTNELVQHSVLAGTFYFNEPRRVTFRARYSF